MSQKNSLIADKVTMRFGGLKAIDDLSFKIEGGSLAGLIGPNGAGKTTVFNVLTGVYQPTEGQIRIGNQSLVGLKPFQVNHLGIARTFQNIRLFKELTVLDNILIAGHQHTTYGLFDVFFQTSKMIQQEKTLHTKAMHLLDLFGLSQKQNELASSLPYGEQRKLEIVRALVTEPQILLLDEPAAGMNHAETDQLMDLISHVKKEFDLTILVIEHDMKLIMNVCEHIVVIDHGVKIEEGNPEKIKNSAKVIEAYLGADIE